MNTAPQPAVGLVLAAAARSFRQCSMPQLDDVLPKTPYESHSLRAAVGSVTERIIRQGPMFPSAWSSDAAIAAAFLALKLLCPGAAPSLTLSGLVEDQVADEEASTVLVERLRVCEERLLEHFEYDFSSVVS